MKYKLLTIVLIVIINLTSLIACAQTKVSMGKANGKDQVGNVLFIAPKNWERLDKSNANRQVIFVAPGANQSTVITILEGQELYGDLETWFEDFLTKRHSNSTVISSGQIIKGSSEEGYPVLLLETELKANDGSISYRFYVAANPNTNRAEVIAFISTDYKEYQQYKEVFSKFIQSIDFTSISNGKAGNSNAMSDNKNISVSTSNESSRSALSSISSNSISGLYVATISRQQFNPVSKFYDYVVRQQYYLFFSDGRIYFGLPQSNIRDINQACQNDLNSCGKYLLSTNELQLTRPGQQTQTFNLTKTNNGFALGNTRFYPINSFDGLRLNDTYSFRSFTNLSGGAGSVNGGVSGERTISFSSDGRFQTSNFVGFAASSGISGAASTTTSNGQGRYQISGNTLTLIYPNNREESFVFFVYPENEQEARPALIIIEGVSYLLRN